MTRTALRLLLALSLVLLVASHAAAADPPDEAIERNDTAQQAFDSGDYETALDDWTRVLELYPNPVTIWNIARSYEELERWTEARDWFERFLATEGLGDEEVARARTRLAAVEAELERLAAESPPDDTVEPPGDTVEAPVATGPVDSAPLDLSWYAWAATGVGAAGVIAAGATWAVLSSSADEANALGPGEFDRYDALVDEIESLETAFYASLAFAAVGTAAAVTLFVLDGTGGDETEPGAATTTSLRVAPGQVDLTVRF